MNIKSLLLGSAAALVAVSGARAADAVVIAEPEPMEYVRVCDTYGAGFYYIPGTETCLRISGMIRYDIDYNDKDPVTVTTPGSVRNVYSSADAAAIAAGASASSFTPIGATATSPVTTTVYGLDEGWAKTAMARVNIDARSETEFGTFRRFIRLEGTVPSGADSGQVNVIFAYVELGGLLVGLYDTLYDADMTPEFDEGGGSRAHQIRYTFSTGNGITVQASLEEQDYNLDYTPNIGGRIAIDQAWGSIAAHVMYDGTTEEVGVKAIGSVKVNDMILLEAMATYESGFGDFSIASGSLTGYEWTVAGAVSVAVNEKITLRGGGQYFADSHIGGFDNYKIGAQVDYKVVENLLARVQVGYNGGDTQDFVDAKFRLESVF